MDIDIFCDMDGVLVDFMAGYAQLTGKRSPQIDSLTPEFWEPINRAYAEGNHWFATLPPMKDCMVLWDFIKRRDGGKTRILTSSAGDIIPSIREDKKFWVKHHLGPDVEVLFATKAELKAQYAGPGQVLIDDSLRALIPWITAGGCGIRHITAKTTIDRLEFWEQYIRAKYSHESQGTE